MLARRLGAIAPLGGDERRAVEQLPARIQVFEPQQDIVHDREILTRCAVLQEGWAFRYKLLDGGRRQILSFHVPGDAPDLQSLHLRPMDHGLATLTRATVAFVPHESLHDLARRFPALATALWRNTLIDGAIYRAWIATLGQRSAYGRLAHLLCELHRRLEAAGLVAGQTCTFPITQGELGNALGLSNVHVNRVLQELRAHDLISLQGRKLSILSWSRLAKAAEFDPAYLHLTAPPEPRIGAG